MTVQFNLRDTTGATTTVPNTGRATGGRLAPRWIGPAALAALAVAGVVGVYGLRNSSPTHESPTTNTQIHAATGGEPLIIAEEQAFIDRQQGRVAKVESLAPVTATGVEPLLIPEEQAFIDGNNSHASMSDDDWCATHDPC